MVIWACNLTVCWNDTTWLTITTDCMCKSVAHIKQQHVNSEPHFFHSAPQFFHFVIPKDKGKYIICLGSYLTCNLYIFVKNKFVNSVQ